MTPKNRDFAYYLGVAAGQVIDKAAMIYGKIYSYMHRKNANAYFKVGAFYTFKEQPLWLDVWEENPCSHIYTPTRRKSDPKVLLRIRPGTAVMILEPLKRHNAGKLDEFATMKILTGETMGYIALMAEHSFCPWHVFDKLEFDDEK